MARVGWLALILLLQAPPICGQEPARPSESQNENQDKKEDEQDERENPEELPALHETVVVTAAKMEQQLGETVSLVNVLLAEDLRQSPNLVLDDQLRQIPGFSLLGRSSSLFAHPTTQGASLRGIGPSGAGRSLVLFDGLPLNDPFGGWVYWNRIPSLALGGVEVARGGTSQLYGSSALGGTIQLLPRAPASNAREVRGRIGTRQTYDLELLLADRRGPWGYTLAGRVFTTDGFFIVDEALRGAVDTRARTEFQTFFGRAYYRDFFAGANLFHEERGNGTRLQNNSTRIHQFQAGFRKESWTGRFYAQAELFKSDFSRILPDRSAEFTTARQRFPSSGLGGSFTWTPRERLLLGADWRWASWNDNDQNLAGVFLQDLRKLNSRLDLLMGVRLDVWENRQAQASVNPRVGLLYRAAKTLTLRASGYRSFRAPTLNELYRSFRVGNIVTDANPDLDEERLWGAEAGADFFPSRSVLLRLNGFWNRLYDPVSNVTLSVTPSLILRQRQNAGRATIKGAEGEAIIRWRSRWRFRSAYLFSDARFGVSGLRLPQVPRHQGTVSITYAGPFTATAESRLVDSQFSDDLNNLRLGGYVVFNAFFRKPLTENLAVFLAGENLLNRKYAVSRVPIERLGTPRLIHGGVSFNLSR